MKEKKKSSQVSFLVVIPKQQSTTRTKSIYKVAKRNAAGWTQQLEKYNNFRSNLIQTINASSIKNLFDNKSSGETNKPKGK